jgi:hypothetical protein
VPLLHHGGEFFWFFGRHESVDTSNSVAQINPDAHRILNQRLNLGEDASISSLVHGSSLIFFTF